MRMVKCFSFIACIILLSTTSFSQHGKLIEPKAIESISNISSDSIKRGYRVDSIVNPLTYLLLDTVNYTHSIAFKKNRKQFNSFRLDRHLGFPDSIAPINITNSKKNELILYRNWSTGNSGAFGGVSVNEELITIYDLKNKLMLFHKVYYSQVESWSTYNGEMESDTTSVEDEDGVIDTYYDIYCECYSIKFEGKKIILIPIENDEDEENIIYEWTKEGFVIY